MDSEKIENLLNLSLDSTMEERDKSLTLNVGYDKIDQTWEIIVKYHGDLKAYESDVVIIELLIPGFAIVTLPQSLINTFAGLEEVEYIEKPKRLYFNVYLGKIASCIPEVTLRPPYLSGEGVIVAIIDSGIDYMNQDFRKGNGKTRILGLWDQTISPDSKKGWLPPSGFAEGVYFNQETINNAIQAENGVERKKIVPSIDITGHGTAVAGIAAGNGSNSSGQYSGVAPNSDLLIVKLGSGKEEGFPKTTELMRALTFVINESVALGKPISINLSFGNTYGAHNGTSLLERFMDNVAEIGRSVICVGSGNEGAASGHYLGVLKQGEEKVIELAIANYELTTSVQLWKSYTDNFELTVTSPSGDSKLVRLDRVGTERIVLDSTELLIYVGSPTPYSAEQEVYIDFIPVGTYIDSGVWSFSLKPKRIVNGYFQMYLPSSAVRNNNTKFYEPNPDITMTIPSTSQKVITVGAYNTVYNSYADFSGRGYQVEGDVINVSLVKPDLVAPGVNITTVNTNGGYSLQTGTSFATPFVTGSAALMMEWGIVMRKDPYLYGEKVKAYLIKGARQLPGYKVFPNAQVGWGALCLADSFPGRI